MQKSLRWSVVAMLLSTTLLLSACGQKGDLYLPEGQAYAGQAD